MIATSRSIPLLLHIIWLLYNIKPIVFPLISPISEGLSHCLSKLFGRGNVEECTHSYDEKRKSRDLKGWRIGEEGGEGIGIYECRYSQWSQWQQQELSLRIQPLRRPVKRREIIKTVMGSLLSLLNIISLFTRKNLSLEGYSVTIPFIESGLDT